MAGSRVTGHVYRLADGKQVQRKLGPAHTGRGRPADGHFTDRTAREALDAILTDARRGALADTPSPGGIATFAEAAAEYVRFVRDVRKVDPTTIKGYVGVIDGYKEILLAEGRLSIRSIVRHLVVLDGIFKRAKRKGWVKDNPASVDLVERPPVVYTGELDTFTRDGVELLATHAANAPDAAIFVRPRTPGYGRASCWRSRGATSISSPA